MAHTLRRPHRWSRESYDKLIEAGVLGTHHSVELIDGQILEMSPEKSRHAAVIDLVAEALRAAYGRGHVVRVQHPLALGTRSEPEPDVAVVPGQARDYLDEHPSGALLVVEVADTSLAFDREVKQSLYARAGIPAYWIVNLKERQLETHSDPRAGRYTQHDVAREGRVTPPGPGMARSIVIDTLLP